MGSSATDLVRVHQETSVNINHKVKVTLTPRGLEVLQDRVREEDHTSRHFTILDVNKIIDLRYRRGDVHVFQLYEFMALFGPELPTFATMDPRYGLFEHNEIILIPEA